MSFALKVRKVRDMPTQKSDEDIKKAVGEHYRTVAVKGKKEACLEEDCKVFKIYTPEELETVPEEASDTSCACGNPVAIAELNEGDVVLDLGSGAGLDVFLAARRVGSSGLVIGIDMTDEMLEKARKAAERRGFHNVSFRKGEIEDLPVDSDSVDVIISNCVINLVTDKDRVFREAYRVLKPGGKLAISDRVLIKELPEGAREDMDLWSACVSSAIMEDDYLGKIAEAGFVDIRVEDQQVFERETVEKILKPIAEKWRREGKEVDEKMIVESYLAVASDRIVAFKPS